MSLHCLPLSLKNWEDRSCSAPLQAETPLNPPQNFNIPKKAGIWKSGFGLLTGDHVSQCGCDVSTAILLKLTLQLDPERGLTILQYFSSMEKGMEYSTIHVTGFRISLVTARRIECQDRMHLQSPGDITTGLRLGRFWKLKRKAPLQFISRLK
jgi:hypothetical protein